MEQAYAGDPPPSLWRGFATYVEFLLWCHSPTRFHTLTRILVWFEINCPSPGNSENVLKVSCFVAYYRTAAAGETKILFNTRKPWGKWFNLTVEHSSTIDLEGWELREESREQCLLKGKRWWKKTVKLVFFTHLLFWSGRIPLTVSFNSAIHWSEFKCQVWALTIYVRSMLLDFF